MAFADDLKKLDALIESFYRELTRKEKNEAKIGDLLKMIELRNKLAPAESDQKEFWRMLENVRRDALSGGEKTGEKPVTNKGRNARRKSR
jgi:hypothetical protein